MAFDQTRSSLGATLAAGAVALLLAAFALVGCGKGPTAPAPLPPISRVVLSLGGDTTVVADTIRVGDTPLFVATAYDTAGVALPGVPFDWSSSSGSVFTVGTGGQVSAVGEGEALLVAEAGGRRDTVRILVLAGATGWFAQVSNSGRQLNGVFFWKDGRHGWAVGNSGEILATVDAGTTWERRTSATIFNLNSVWFPDDVEPDTGYVAGNSGTVLKTVDGGLTWVPTTTHASENLNGIRFATADTGWAVGSAGAVLRTFDGGATWSKLNPTSFELRGVAFAGTRLGWAVGDGGVILGTTDRGLTWTVESAVTSQSLHGVWRLGDSVAVAVGQQGVAPRTVDVGGTPTWQLRNAGASNQLEGVCLATPQIGFAVGTNGGGIVLRTDDGGQSWTTQSVPAGTSLYGVFFLDHLRGWAVGANGRIVHTGSGGLP
jgi:photosystem II stability/assembly factor-like uncharacterized protein